MMLFNANFSFTSSTRVSTDCAEEEEERGRELTRGREREEGRKKEEEEEERVEERGRGEFLRGSWGLGMGAVPNRGETAKLFVLLKLLLLSLCPKELKV